MGVLLPGTSELYSLFAELATDPPSTEEVDNATLDLKSIKAATVYNTRGTNS